MKAVSSPTFVATIYIAGSRDQIVQASREWCLQGACVSIVPCDFVFTMGMESGFAVNLINYPRFPQSNAQIHRHAVNFAEFLIERLCQGSASVVSPIETVWLSRRDD
ncbi:hypothetical protein [Sphingopyxis sp. GW247-27LB]|uniref:hypothetical protein n=1 Tax=Sphingopyxis sp. GW247-27LB TaxID=2012632 RepID=UPI000BA72642|nr:hypothetical protein [Sphingopyxis sp. GW247-27LB]PAL23558.1 hypothetical protein CD928_05685 [Sphingopyxis sp. GW247-27LB]